MSDDEAMSRRRFCAAALIAGAGATSAAAQDDPSPDDAEPPMADAGPDSIDATTLAAAQRIAGLELDEAERRLAARSVAGMPERWESLRAVGLTNDVAPATTFDPLAPLGPRLHPTRASVTLAPGDPGPPPRDEADLAFAPVTALARWLESGAVSSERLTRLYLDRLRRHGPRLECVATLTEELALEQARRADADRAAERVRSPLQGIPWGAKDLFDTAGIPTTWGATPYLDRPVPERDADVVARLHDAGAVLVAKTTLGALAYGDLWSGGRTRNPWNPRQGSSGSSAGSAAGAAAGLFGFALGTETYGSIISPCMRCGVTGLRPTFGRVARGGAMALCPSLDKIGPIARSVEDCVLAFAAIAGAAPRDPSSIARPFVYDGRLSVAKRRVGIDPAWFAGRAATDADRAALDALRAAEVEIVEIEWPTLPTASLLTILEVEAAAMFDELTRSNRDDLLRWQEPEAWPNTFRAARFVPAVELVQAQRFRSAVCARVGEIFADVDALLSPSFVGDLLLVTNFTGHPALVVPVAEGTSARPRGVTLWGRLHDEGTLCRLGLEIERRVGAATRRPPDCG